VVVPRTTAIEVQVYPREGEAQLTVDGQTNVALEAGDTVHITGSEFPVHFATSPHRSRFDLLRTKLHWGSG
jgi:NAD+ kinase